MRFMGSIQPWCWRLTSRAWRCAVSPCVASRAGEGGWVGEWVVCDYTAVVLAAGFLGREVRHEP